MHKKKSSLIGNTNGYLGINYENANSGPYKIGGVSIEADITRNVNANIALLGAEVIPAQSSTDLGNSSYKWDKGHIQNIY